MSPYIDVIGLMASNHDADGFTLELDESLVRLVEMLTGLLVSDAEGLNLAKNGVAPKILLNHS